MNSSVKDFPYTTYIIMFWFPRHSLNTVRSLHNMHASCMRHACVHHHFISIHDINLLQISLTLSKICLISPSILTVI